MKKTAFILGAFAILFAGCGSSPKLSAKKMLEYSGRDRLPGAEEYQEDGAVILYEDTKTQFYLGSDWELKRKQTFHAAFCYFNDKAVNWLTQTIYLDNNRSLINFYARTIKPDSTVLKVLEKDL